MTGIWQNREFETGTARILRNDDGDYEVLAEAPRNREYRIVWMATFPRESDAINLRNILNKS